MVRGGGGFCVWGRSLARASPASIESRLGESNMSLSHTLGLTSGLSRRRPSTISWMRSSILCFSRYACISCFSSKGGRETFVRGSAAIQKLVTTPIPKRSSRSEKAILGATLGMPGHSPSNSRNCAEDLSYVKPVFSQLRATLGTGWTLKKVSPTSGSVVSELGWSPRQNDTLHIA